MTDFLLTVAGCAAGAVGVALVIECVMRVVGPRPRPEETRGDDVRGWIAGAVAMALAIALTRWVGWGDSPFLSYVPFGVAIGVLIHSPGVFAALRVRGEPAGQKVQ